MNDSCLVTVTPSVLRFNQNTKPCHEYHVYVLLHVVNEKLNFIALILKLNSNLLLDQILSNTAQFIIVILMQLQLLLFFSSLISHLPHAIIHKHDAHDMV